MKEKNHSLAGVLRGCSLSSYNGKELVIETKYKFHKEKLEDREAIKTIKEVLKGVTGNNLNITVQISKN